MILVWLMIFAVTSLMMAIRAIRCKVAVDKYEKLLANHVEHQRQSLETRYKGLKSSLHNL